MSKKSKITIFAVLDAICLTASWILALVLTGQFTDKTLTVIYPYFLIELVAMYVIFIVLRLYVSIWEYAGFTDLIRLIVAVTAMFVIKAILTVISGTLEIKWYFFSALFFALLVFIEHFGLRTYNYIARRVKKRKEEQLKGIRTIIIGAGAAGGVLINDVVNSKTSFVYPVCLLDDDPKKIGLYISGIKVVGQVKDVVKYATLYKATQIIIAINSITDAQKARIIKECQQTDCKILALDEKSRFADGENIIKAVKEVNIYDLLGREPVKVNTEEIMGYIENKVILVTGGGGSIGSELCRQIAKHNPKLLIILDMYENNAYDIQQELLRHYHDLNLIVLVASVRDSVKMEDVFKRYNPQIVFHAAAHKHVPLMETSPNEAVKNNVSGTYKVADAAGRHGVEKFILISTDKAVNPTNVMGATKRICEMIVQAMNDRYPKTNFAIVRFGNVLGSNGSVIPLFKKQIEEGGPVTVTDANIVRYFMTIPEAVNLVLQAGAYAKGGEIFVLDMGNPVKIFDLAVNMIRLCGFEPFKDIDIKIIGLRPGEKLYEERLMAEEGLQKTANDMISIGKPIEFDHEKLFEDIKLLYEEAYHETEHMKELIAKVVPTYKIDERKL